MEFFISPHFDDAIGSCGCRIASEAEKGKSPCVITVFAGNRPDNISEFAKQLLNMWGLRDGVKERAAENETACHLIGAKTVNLDFVEGLYRMKGQKWKYPVDGDLFGRIVEDDNTLSASIAEQIRRNCDINDVLVFPSGRGNHVDHLITLQAGLLLEKYGYHVEFYEDFSYEGEVFLYPNVESVIYYFNEEMLNKKISAVSAYTSQLSMLFGKDGPESYYSQYRQEGGMCFEKYYLHHERTCSDSDYNHKRKERIA